MSGWLAGSAVSPFPIDPGTLLGGYADRTGPSTGTLDALEIGALSLWSGGREIHVVTADVMGVDTELAVEVASAAGIGKDDILVCASHTHSGPIGVVHRLHPANPDAFDPGLRGRFVHALADTLRQARAVREPAILEHAEAGVDGVWSNRNDPAIATDLRVRSLVVRRLDGFLHTLLMLVPCHPTVLGAWNLDVSADLHGAVRRAVKSRLLLHDSGTHLLTITGAAGDISTRFARRESSATEADRIGSLVGERVIASLPDSRPIVPGIQSRSVSRTLLPRTVDPATVQAGYTRAMEDLDRLKANPTGTEAEIRRAYTRVQGAGMLRDMGGLSPVTLSLSAWRLGPDFGIVAIPGEPFRSIGLEIETGSPLAATWVAGYANGYLGYIADTAAYDRETYEALASPYDRTVGGLMVDMARRLTYDLRELA